MIRIDNARVFDGERVLDGVSVLVEDGIVTGVAPPGDLEATAGSRAPDEIVDASGHTLLPGLIDGHTHVVGTLSNLRLALAFGVTTELDMFSFPPDLTAWLCETAARTDDVADLRSSGTVACPTGGHPVASMPFIPSLSGPQDADEYVTARQKEGAHYLKLMFDDGRHHGADLPTLDEATSTAVTAAARSAGLLTVAHVADTETVRGALAAGVDALTHVPLEEPIPEALVRRAVTDGRFFIPTLAMMEMSSGARGGRDLIADDRIADHLPADAVAAISSGAEGLSVTVPSPGLDFGHALETVRRLHDAGVPLVAGTDANSGPGRACPVVHGAALHRELELLTAAGLPPKEALKAATSAPARLFGLHDRGRIAPGLRADLLLVEGDPTVDITTTRAIRRIWRQGIPFDREAFRRAWVEAPDTGHGENGGRDAGTATGSALSAVGSTALGVAAARALESGRPDRLFDDQVAVQCTVAAGSGLAAWTGAQGELVRMATGDYFALRTRYFDTCLLQAVEAGCRQVVVLAAGLDARAFRLNWPAEVRLFELDRPDVFSFKHRIVDGRVPMPGCERTAVVGDLRDDWPSALRSHGFDASVPTAWLMEGIIVYLTEREGDDVLARIDELSAPSSRLALEYGSLAMFDSEGTRAALSGTAESDTMHMLASLWRNERTADPLTWLAAHGWSADGHSIADLAHECGRPVPPAFDPDVAGTARIDLISGIRTPDSAR
ncbi:SAM-dependent methyltransferase [Streptomyces sp. NPDC047108]|uniref:SAM-dependent methyltransferase n=1 Tax=Streptomyces sp. NPDC047108 TaxID=3155025 RepID=UPI003406573B